VRSYLQTQDHFHETDGFTQNRRQKVVKWGLCVCAGGALRLRRGGLTFIVDKSGIDWYCFIFQFGAAWSVIWGISPTNSPWRRDWFHFKTSASKLVSGSVLGVFGNMVHWLFNSFIQYDAARVRKSCLEKKFT